MNDYPSRAWFSKKQADKLRTLLPAFSLLISDDKKPAETQGESEEYLILRQQYLSFYNIDFADEFGPLNIQHRMGKIQSAGFNIALQSWQPAKPKAWIMVAHGYYDHLGIYQHLLRFLLQQGFAVLGFDLPGHGLSDGERACIDDFNRYSEVLADVRALLRSQAPKQSQEQAQDQKLAVHVLGQSTGCAIIMNSLFQSAADDYDKVMLLAPLFRPKAWDSGQWLFKLLNKRIATMPRRFAINSHNREFLHFLSELDPLQPKQLSVQWVGAMKQWFEAMEAMATEGQRSDKPLLIIQGTDDQTVDWEYNLPQIETLFSDLSIELVEDGRHQLVNEAERYRKVVFRHLSQYLAQ